MGLPPLIERDYSLPFEYDLSKNKPNKTVDIGRNGTTVSADPFGTTLQLGTYHQVHGIILAAPYEQFDKSQYYDPSYVRKYRAKMLEMVANRESGFGIRIADALPQVAIGHRTMDAARTTFRTQAGAEVSCNLVVHDDGSFAQNVVVVNESAETISVRYHLDLRLSVHRASYGQLTEGGPVPLPECENHLALSENETAFVVSNPILGANLSGRLFVDGQPAPLDGVTSAVSKGILEQAKTTDQVLTAGPKSTVTLVAWFKLSPGLEPVPPPAQPPKVDDRSIGVDDIWHDAKTAKSYILRRNVDYILGNCCYPVDNDIIGIITDHVALPLGWNRDNYWQWRLLLHFRQNISKHIKNAKVEQYKQTIDRVLKGHLPWMFQRAGRPHGFWHRSYIIAGPPKDGPVFQLDQQCYPFLELCDYFDQFPEDKVYVESILKESSATEVLDLIISKRDPETGLYPTDETPGDDKVDHPFHFSSHVLLWYTLDRMAKLTRTVTAPESLSSEKLQPLADGVRDVTKKNFFKKDDVSGESRIAYLVDGKDEKTFYHDANDIPTIYAKDWGFLTSGAELEAWKNTLRFAMSTVNKLGYSTGGPFTGLGSVHSQGPWPLGYFQELFYAQKNKDDEARKSAVRRILGAMQWDGTFGEAIDAQSGATTSKAWFSWPGSMIGAELVLGGIDI